MKKLSSLLVGALATLAIHTGCKKSNNSTPIVPDAFADSLAKSCTAAFVGRGDSSNIYLPTAFTPNGDGINDVYTLNGTGVTYAGAFTNFQLKIYDTLGDLVYQATAASFKLWDGTDMTTGKQSTHYKFYVKVNYTTAGGIVDSGGTYLFRLAGTTCISEVAADSSKYEFPDQFEPTSGFNASFPSDEIFCK